MRTFKGEFITLDPIAHTSPAPLGVKKGNLVELRKMKVNYHGEIYSIPFISGNSLRATLRSPLVDEFLSTIGITKEELAEHNRDLYYSLYSGGALDRKAKDVGAARKNAIDKTKQFASLFSTIEDFVNNLPTLSLFGGVFFNRLMEGRFNVGNIVALTKQNANLYNHEEDNLPNCGEIVELMGFVSHDAMRKLFSLSIDDEDDLETDETDSEGEQKEIKDKHRPMPFHMEVLCPNVTMLTEIFIKPSASELEKSTAVRAIEIFNEHPVVGLRSSAGFGRLKGKIDIGDSSSEIYLDHIKKNASHIKDFIMQITE